MGEDLVLNLFQLQVLKSLLALIDISTRKSTATKNDFLAIITAREGVHYLPIAHHQIGSFDLSFDVHFYF